MALQVQTARNSLEDRLKDLTDVDTDTFVGWCDFINKRAYNFMLGIDPTRYFSTQSYVVATMPQTSALPATFRNILPAESGFFLIDNGVQTDQRLTRTNFGSQEAGYYIDGTNVVFTGMEASDTYALRFIPEITQIDALTDWFTVSTAQAGIEIIPDEYLEFLVSDLVVLYHSWDEESGAESLADFRFTRLLGEMGRNVKREPNTYSIPNFASNF